MTTTESTRLIFALLVSLHIFLVHGLVSRVHRMGRRIANLKALASAQSVIDRQRDLLDQAQSKLDRAMMMGENLTAREFRATPQGAHRRGYR